MITTAQWVVLVVIAILGHVMGLIWYLAVKNKWKLSERTIYDLPISDAQIKRELKNSLHAPMHAVILAAFLFIGFFENTSPMSFVGSAVATTIWAETWHYVSHRAFHLRPLHWIHVEHHKSHLNSPFTAISFSFTEKLVFDIGLLCPLAGVDHFISLNFFGIAAWYIGYLVINSFSHANFELKSHNYNRWFGQLLTTTTYHSLHHSRYTGHYGLEREFWIGFSKPNGKTTKGSMTKSPVTIDLFASCGRKLEKQIFDPSRRARELFEKAQSTSIVPKRRREELLSPHVADCHCPPGPLAVATVLEVYRNQLPHPNRTGMIRRVEPLVVVKRPVTANEVDEVTLHGVLRATLLETGLPRGTCQTTTQVHKKTSSRVLTPLRPECQERAAICSARTSTTTRKTRRAGRPPARSPRRCGTRPAPP